MASGHRCRARRVSSARPWRSPCRTGRRSLPASCTPHDFLDLPAGRLRGLLGKAAELRVDAVPPLLVSLVFLLSLVGGVAFLQLAADLVGDGRRFIELGPLMFSGGALRFALAFAEHLEDLVELALDGVLPGGELGGGRAAGFRLRGAGIIRHRWPPSGS